MLQNLNHVYWHMLVKQHISGKKKQSCLYRSGYPHILFSKTHRRESCHPRCQDTDPNAPCFRCCLWGLFHVSVLQPLDKCYSYHCGRNFQYLKPCLFLSSAFSNAPSPSSSARPPKLRKWNSINLLSDRVKK